MNLLGNAAFPLPFWVYSSVGLATEREISCSAANTVDVAALWSVDPASIRTQEHLLFFFFLYYSRAHLPGGNSACDGPKGLPYNAEGYKG
jgi:hypothetical protein